MARRKKRIKPERAATVAPAPLAPRRPRRRWVTAAALLVAALGASVAIALVARRDRTSRLEAEGPVQPVAILEPQEQAFAGYAGSESCRECHAAVDDAWKHSHHALAEFPTSQPMDNPPVEKHPELKDPPRVIGYDPLRQFLVSSSGGRFQVSDTAYDPHKREWFNVFGEEQRQPGEWGHWTGRGMNWNSMCAACHNTRLRKNYDRASDTYGTKMVEMGIGCESCHGPMKDHVAWQREHDGQRTASGAPALADPTIKPVSRDQAFDTCGSCHSRRGELTGDFRPGDSYHDHYRLSVVDESDLYYPDGQVRDEDFEMAAFLGSKMHAAGVRCVDCHNAHTGKPVASGDFMCMRCHQGIDTHPTAPIIKPAEHVFHKPESEGARCVNCHMPQTTYMQRHVRHDHGFTIPDPLLTKQHAIPNACNRCHTDKDAQWSIDAVQKWYGKKMDRPSRTRAQTIAAARAGDDSARQPLLDLLANEKETPYWKSVAAGMLGTWAADPSVQSALLGQLRHADPLVRAAAARSLEPLVESRPDVRSALEGLLSDPRRNVRLAAAWGLRATVDPQSPAGRELLHLMDVSSDQPLGKLQSAHYHLARRDPTTALRELATAVQWDPGSAGMRQEMAVVHSVTGNAAAAVKELREAVRLAPQEAEYRYLLGLALNETGDLPAATSALGEAVRLDPKHASAWYNLGLAQHAAGNAEAALQSLMRGESANPSDPRIPYARATILLQLDRRPEALDAARRSLEIRPDFAPARQLLGI